jgi:patatin-like phospholipase/acyl hydrolase
MKFTILPLVLFLAFFVASSTTKGLRGDMNLTAVDTNIQALGVHYDNHHQQRKKRTSVDYKRYEEEEDKNVIYTYFTGLRDSTAES